MNNKLRFGRRLPLPSTLQIRRELLQFIDAEERRVLLAARHRLPTHSSWRDIANAQAAASTARGVTMDAISDVEDQLAEETRVVDTFHAEEASPAKGMAQLRRGLTENTLRSLRAED